MDITFGVAQGAADEHGCSIANVGGDDGFGETGLVEVGKRGVDRIAEIDAGIDQGAVEVEGDEARWGRKRHHFTIID